jgi:hypothetical protein
MCSGRYISITIALLFFSISTAFANYPYNGSLKGQLDVSPTGAAMYSIPIDVPPGVNCRWCITAKGVMAYWVLAGI